MKQSRAKLAGAIADRTLTAGPSRQLARELAAYLLAEGRVNELSSIMRDVQAAWADAGYVEVIARTAHALPASAEAKIKAQVKPLYPQAKKIVVSRVPDPAVLGGVEISLANHELDLSVEAKLNKFKQLTTGKD